MSEDAPRWRLLATDGFDSADDNWWLPPAADAGEATRTFLVRVCHPDSRRCQEHRVVIQRGISSREADEKIGLAANLAWWALESTNVADVVAEDRVTVLNDPKFYRRPTPPGEVDSPE